VAIYVVHYSEIGIKGGNRLFFERRLMANIATALALPALAVRRLPGRLLVDSGDLAAEPTERRLAALPGIAHFAPATVTSLDLAALSDEAVRCSQGVEARSFRIRSQRSNKRFPLTSVELNRLLGAAVVEATALPVDLDGAEHTVHVEVLDRQALVYTRRQPGLGGLPVGSSGTVVALLSGGIDSPVAAFKLIRRGCEVRLLHFHNYTRDQEAVRAKLLDLAAVLARYQQRSHLLLVPFAEIQSALIAAIPAPARMVGYRRAMMHIASIVAERERATALVTGDSVGQVASQTLVNLQAIHAAARHPVLSPLIGDDKQDVVALARRIGTYQVSIRPHQDCCSFLVPRHPDTQVRLDRLVERESSIPLEALAARALDGAEALEVGPDE